MNMKSDGRCMKYKISNLVKTNALFAYQANATVLFLIENQISPDLNTLTYYFAFSIYKQVKDYELIRLDLALCLCSIFLAVFRLKLTSPLLMVKKSRVHAEIHHPKPKSLATFTHASRQMNFDHRCSKNLLVICQRSTNSIVPSPGRSNFQKQSWMQVVPWDYLH